ncbi:Rad60-SLD 2 domain containing protein [Trichuris trichiura]|uniref:Rad60-SLD 2 domain containing protein n=1 Tax=Trichuris trichiura TaxID=36087 RepID=A0A077ZG28_TRITR|nr:Rad60-SLD 2 domain containing protein [Trichuris trichiura]
MIRSTCHQLKLPFVHWRSSNDSLFQINLRLILVCGKTSDFLFPSTYSAADVAQYVFDHWPSEWEDERVQSASLLKLIYHGRFLHGNVTLGVVLLSALTLPLGKTTVMHLVARKSLPEPSSQGKRDRCRKNSFI